MCLLQDRDWFALLGVLHVRIQLAKRQLLAEALKSDQADVFGIPRPLLLLSSAEVMGITHLGLFYCLLQ